MSSGPSPAPSEPRTTSTRRSVEDVTCLACGCLCDDLTVTVEGGLVVEVGSACEVGRSWFFSESGREPAIAASIEGQPVSTEEAIDRAVRMLGEARAPVVFGLTRTVTETRTRGAWPGGPSRCAGRSRSVRDGPGPGLRGYPGQGRVTATLGEVKNRADLVVFWGADPRPDAPSALGALLGRAEGPVRSRGASGQDGRRGRCREDRHGGASGPLRPGAGGSTPGSPGHAPDAGSGQDAPQDRRLGSRRFLGLPTCMKMARYGALFVQARRGFGLAIGSDLGSGGEAGPRSSTISPGSSCSGSEGPETWPGRRRP